MLRAIEASGASEVALDISADELTSCFVRHAERLTMEEFRRCMDPQATGAVSISLGLVSTFADVYACLTFAHTFLDKTVQELIVETQVALAARSLCAYAGVQ